MQTSCSQLFPQDPALKLCLVQSLCMVSQAMCSSAQASSFQFSRKAELVAQMMVSSRQLLQPGSEGGSWGGQRHARSDAAASTTHFMKETEGAGSRLMPPLRACCVLPPQGIHQSRTPRLPENTYSEESHACLHIPGVSFPASALSGPVGLYADIWTALCICNILNRMVAGPSP